MQIQRFDHEPHLYAEPKSPLRPAPEQQGATGAAAANSADRQSTRQTGGDSRLAGWQEELGRAPAVREDVVQAAREKVLHNEYLTRSAAERLAGTELFQELFSHRP